MQRALIPMAQSSSFVQTARFRINLPNGAGMSYELGMWARVKHCVIAFFLGLAVVAGGASPAMAQEAEDDKGSGNECISLSQVRRSQILDDHTILFHMSGKRIKKATLAFGCPSLKFYGSFSYRSYNNRLCARFDTIVSRSGAHCPISEISDYTPPDEPADKDTKDDD
jgi:hypothetical protein